MNSQILGGSDWVLVESGESFDYTNHPKNRNDVEMGFAPFTHIEVLEDETNFSVADFGWRNNADTLIDGAELDGKAFAQGYVLGGEIKSFTLSAGSVKVFRR